jgi:hypothetical protein
MHTGFCWKPEGKRPSGGPRIRWKDIIYLREIGEDSVDWIHLAQNMDQ